MLVLALVLASTDPAPIVLDGDVPAGDDRYFDLPFEVPAGIREIQVHHEGSDGDVLDFGVYGPAGEFRGWGGGNKEDAIVGDQASSRSYLPGPIPAGTWTVDVGKARLTSSAPHYHVEITLRTSPTLEPPTDRTRYREAPPFKDKPGFYAGDFHVHSEDSGDATPPLDDIAQFAISKGLDFVVVTDHNTVAQTDRLVDERNPELLMLPGIEYTTYLGHATAFGALEYVDHRMGHNGVTIEKATAAFQKQGVVFSINHPALDLGTVCIGCAWKNDIPPKGSFHGVEIETGAYSEAGYLFEDKAIDFWESLLDDGHHLAALGGSDDHSAGKGGTKGIGSPCTVVHADKLSQDAIKQAILDSRTQVKLEDCNAPLIDLETDAPRTGDTALGDVITISATVTGGKGAVFKFVQNGEIAGAPQSITADPQTFTLQVTADDSGEQRVRAEIDDASDAHPLTVTSYVWLKQAPAGGCACGSSSPVSVAWWSVFACARALLRKRGARSLRR